MTISENIALGPTINRAPAAQVEPRIAEMAERLNIGDIWIKYPYQVSGGQKQRCACARALVNRPGPLPTGALDSHSAQMLEYDAEHQQADGINDPDGNPRCFYRKLRRAHPVSSGRGNFYGAGKRRRWQERIFEKDSACSHYDRRWTEPCMQSWIFRNAGRSVRDYLIYIVTMSDLCHTVLFLPVHLQQLLSSRHRKYL